MCWSPISRRASSYNRQLTSWSTTRPGEGGGGGGARVAVMNPPTELYHTSKRRAEWPRREFFVADAALLGLGLLARRDGDDLFEDALADLLERLGAVQNRAGVDVHVVGHVFVQRRVRRDFDAGG